MFVFPKEWTDYALGFLAFPIKNVENRKKIEPLCNIESSCTVVSNELELEKQVDYDKIHQCALFHLLSLKISNPL